MTPMFRAHQVVELEAMSAALNGHWSEALSAAARLLQLDAALDKVASASIDLRLGVIGEYLLVERGVQQISEGVDPGRLASGKFDRFLFDPGETLVLLGERTKPIAAWAADPSRPEPPPTEPLEKGVLWWTHNPLGKRLLDSTRVHMVPIVRKSAAQRTFLQQRGRELQQQCAELKASAPAQ
jgi:hypothetical protein